MLYAYALNTKSQISATLLSAFSLRRQRISKFYQVGDYENELETPYFNIFEK